MQRAGFAHFVRPRMSAGTPAPARRASAGLGLLYTLWVLFTADGHPLMAISAFIVGTIAAVILLAALLPAGLALVLKIPKIGASIVKLPALLIKEKLVRLKW